MNKLIEKLEELSKDKRIGIIIIVILLIILAALIVVMVHSHYSYKETTPKDLISTYTSKLNRIKVDENEEDKSKLEKAKKTLTYLKAKVEGSKDSFVEDDDVREYNALIDKINDKLDDIDNIIKKISKKPDDEDIDEEEKAEESEETEEEKISEKDTPDTNQNTEDTASDSTEDYSTWVPADTSQAEPEPQPEPAPEPEAPPVQTNPAYGTVTTSQPEDNNGGWQCGTIAYQYCSLYEDGTGEWEPVGVTGDISNESEFQKYASTVAKPDRVGSAGETVSTTVWVWLD